MVDTLYANFVRRWQEVTQVPPQRLGSLTPVYKILVKRLKAMPVPILVVGAFLLVVCLYLVLGRGITNLVNLLQRGF